MKLNPRREKLNRYTTLPVLLDLLTRKRLVLLDPVSWEDKNDSQILIEYKNRKRVDKLFALCFSHGDETIHHWRTFADGISGCCIEFDKKLLIEKLRGISGLRFKHVAYKKLKDLKDAIIKVNDIPFTKRWPYRCEEEYRIIWEGTTPQNSFEIDIDLQIISKITLNQKMPEIVYQTIRRHLRQAFSDPDKRINRSTLYENQVWIKKFKQNP